MSNMEWIGYAVGIAGVLVGLAGWLRNNRGDTAEQARWMGGIDYQLKDISRKLDDLNGIPGRMKAVEDRLKDIERKLEKHIDEHGREG